MSDTLSFAEIDGQQVELLPPRIVLSVFATGASGGSGTNGSTGAHGSGTGGGTGGSSGAGKGGIPINLWSGMGFLGGTGTVTAGNGTGGAGATPEPVAAEFSLDTLPFAGDSIGLISACGE